MIKLFKNNLFTIGLLIRLVMLVSVFPHSASIWYVPFISITTDHFTYNPWHSFIEAHGTTMAFPYGYAMWLSFVPLTLLAKKLDINIYYAYGFTLLIADISLLYILKKLLRPTNQLLLIGYWLSPIILFSTYWLGFNDLIPVLFLCIALNFVRQLKLIQAGIFCSLAISAKLSMILAIPFFIIYLYRNPALRCLLSRYLMSFFSSITLIGLPYLLSSDGMYMLLHNPEMNKIYAMTLQMGNNIVIYVLPIVYLLMLYLAWHIRRINFELLNLLFGLSFLLVILLTPASPGWFIWVIPLLILYQSKKGNIATVLVTGFTVSYVIINLISSPAPSIFNSAFFSNYINQINHSLGPQKIALLYTLLIAFGIILFYRIWHEMIKKNDYYRLSRKPFIIGIVGDSGSGKDTLAGSIQGLFGGHSSVTLSGDDYHLWDRQKPIWQALTHLNPQANALEQYATDLISLANGKPIQIRHYNHETGKMTHPHQMKSNDFIIASGLHTLYLPILRNCYDLSIYLDIDEDLRRYFKIQRDVEFRGHSIEKVMRSIRSREEDAKKFIHPQLNHADLILSLQPIHPRLIQDYKKTRPLRLKLVVHSRKNLNESSLLRVLIGVCGLHVDLITNPHKNEISLTIEGETTADDIALAAKTLLPNIHNFLDIIPRWEDGIKGLMQLVVLLHINQSLCERLL